MGVLSKDRKAFLRSLNLPSDAQMRQRVTNFMLTSGLTASELADALGYSLATIHNFRNGNYGSNALDPKGENSLNIKAALKEYMDSFESQQPLPETRKHHRTDGFERVRVAAITAMRKGTAYVVDGPPGTEKTWSLRQIEREIKDKRLGRPVYVYTRINHSPQSFLQEVCCAAGVPNRGQIDQLLRKLAFFLSSGRTLLMVDEAQHLNHDGLEVLRQLLDQPPYFGVILAGSHDLTQRLSHWQMEQWRSRVRKTIYLNGPTEKEAAAILRAEISGISATEIQAVIGGCRSSATRTVIKGGKPVPEKFDYISARDLFFSIERAQEALATHTKKAGAA